MQLGLIGGVAAVVLVGLGAGWMLAAPRNTAAASPPTAAAPPAAPQTTPTPGDETAEGWPERRQLRDRLYAAVTRFEASPCNDEARIAFKAAYLAQVNAQMQDAHERGEGDIPGFWHTAYDKDLEKSVARLISEDYLTQEEIAGTVMNSNPLARMQMQQAGWRPQQALVLVERCGELPRGDTANRMERKRIDQQMRQMEARQHDADGRHVYAYGR